MSRTGPVWPAWGPLFLGFVTAALLFGGLGTWSVLATLSSAVIGPGKLDVSQNQQQVQHLEGGVVSAIYVREGSRVKEGDILLRLDDTLLRAEFRLVEGQLWEGIARRARLEAQSSNAEKLVFPDTLVALAKDNPGLAELMAGQESLFAKSKQAVTQAIQ